MKLAIVYHVYKNSLTLQKSLENLFNQTDKNFEFILINDGASSRVAKILKEFKLSNFKNLTYFKYSQNLGHSLSFNQAIQNTTADYVMFVGSNFIPHKDFVKTINNILKTNQHVDGISFNVQKNNGSYQTFSKLNAKAKLMLGQSMRDKIFSTRLLREHKIVLNEHIYAPFTFIYQNLVQAQKWIIVDYDHALYEKNKIYTYNFYDIFEQNDALIAEYSKTKFWNANLDLIEYFMIVYVIYIFLIRIFHTYPNKTVQQNAIAKTKSWLDANIPNWRKNIILNNPKNRQPQLSQAFIKIKFKINYIKKMIRNHKL